MKEEEPPFEPMPISEVKELYDKINAGEAWTPYGTKRVIETLFWLTNEHAQAMNDLQNMKWMKVALMAITHQWGRGGKLGISPKATEKIQDNWQLAVSVDLKGSIKLKIEGYPKSNLILPGGFKR